MTEKLHAGLGDSEISTELRNLREIIEKKPRDLTPWVTLLTVLVAAVGIYFSVGEFNEQQKASFQQKYWEKQAEIYGKACDAAASISAGEELSQIEKERKTFKTLYWGSMSIVEHPEVKKAMNDFMMSLQLWEDKKKKPQDIDKLSYRLAVCCRKSLRKTWDPANIGLLDDAAACPY